MSFVKTYVNVSPDLKDIPIIYDDTFPLNITENNFTDSNNKTYKRNTASISQWKDGQVYYINSHISTFPCSNLTVGKCFYRLQSSVEDSIYKYYSIYHYSNGVASAELGTDGQIYALGTGASTFNVNNSYCAIIVCRGFILFAYSLKASDGKYSLYGFGNHIDFINQFLTDIKSEIKSNEYGDASEEGGYSANFDNTSDVIGVPSMPSTGVTNVGFINVYKTNANALQNLGSELFPDFIPPTPASPTDSVGDALVQGFNNVVDNLTQLLNTYINSNLINYIIDCHCIPVSPSVSTSEKIKIGFKEFSQSANKVTTDFVDFDCGTLNIKEYYGNFIDYVGTRAQLYLPFIGFVPIKNEFFQNGLLQVKYRFNIVDGSFMCYLLSSSSKSQLNNSIVGTYSGNACIHLPITGLNYSNMISGVINGVSTIASGGGGNVGNGINSALNTLALKPELQSSNSYNSTSAYLGVRYPYLLIEREVSNFSTNYPNEYGLPLNVTKAIKDLSGFVQMDNIHIHIPCMEEEKGLILDALTSGIIV